MTPFNLSAPFQFFFHMQHTLAVILTHTLHNYSQTTNWSDVRSKKLCLHPAVFSLHPAAGGCADVHPCTVLEVLSGAPPAVGPQLHHGRVGPLLQPRRHSGQADDHVRTAELWGVGWMPSCPACVHLFIMPWCPPHPTPPPLKWPNWRLLQLSPGGEVSDDQAQLAGAAVLLPAVSRLDLCHAAVRLHLPGLLPATGVRHRRVPLRAARWPACQRPVHPRQGAV